MDMRVWYKNAMILIDDMRRRREPMLSFWQDIQKYILPWHGRNLAGENSSEVDSDERDHSDIFSQAPEDAVDRLAAGFQYSITPRSDPWFSLSPEDQALMMRYAVRTYLAEVERRMRLVYSKSNLYDALHAVYLELIAFGTAAMAALEDDDYVVRFKTFTAGEYMIAADDRGRVNVFYREMWMTARQMLSKFGKDNLSVQVQTALEKGQTELLFRVCQLIYPNDGAVKDFALLDKPYVSVYFEKEGMTKNDKALEIKGYYEFPVMVVRWRVVGDDVWGRSPAMKVLPDVKSLYKIAENTLIALDKVLDPPLVAPGSLKNDYVDTFPGGVNFSDDISGADAFKPIYQIRPDIKSAEYIKEQLVAAIQRGFFNDIFLMLTNTPDTKRMTAYEVQGRKEEKMTMLGPVLGRLQGELLEQIIDRTFAIMYRKGVLPTPPRELAGSDLKVEYLSILAKAQEMSSVNAMLQMLNFAGALAQVKQEVLDKLNADGMLDEFAEKLGVPPQALLPEDQVMAIRKQRAEQQAQMQQMAAAQSAANMAQTAGKTPLGDGTVLDKIMERVDENS